MEANSIAYGRVGMADRALLAPNFVAGHLEMLVQEIGSETIEAIEPPSTPRTASRQARSCSFRG